jgi:hypothetical protein
VRGHLASETGCGLNIGEWSMRSLLDNETGEREEGRGGEAMESKTDSPLQRSKLAKFGPARRAGIRN